MIGASGSIAGVLGAYLYFFPKAKVLVLIPFLFFLLLKFQLIFFLFFGFYTNF